MFIVTTVLDEAGVVQVRSPLTLVHMYTAECKHVTFVGFPIFVYNLVNYCPVLCIVCLCVCVANVFNFWSTYSATCVCVCATHSSGQRVI
jgi:hypothetical protein